MNILKLILVDEGIIVCFNRYGVMLSYLIGICFRLFEFGVVSLLPPFILNNTLDKYSNTTQNSTPSTNNIFIAGLVSFFGMKLFAKIIEILSPESIPSLMKNLKESNARLEESNARLEESNARLEESNARLEESNKNLLDTMNKQFSELPSKINAPYTPYDSPRNGD
jgi:cell division protein FtsB